MEKMKEKDSFVNKKERKKWIKENKKFIHTLPLLPKYIMLIFFYNKEMFHISKISAFHFTWVHVVRQFKLLEQIGFLESEKIGRNKKWKITEKGKRYCRVLLERFK